MFDKYNIYCRIDMLIINLEGDIMNDIKDVVEQIKNRCDIVSLISEYIQVIKTGNTYKALCPFHQEKTPSFHISETKQMCKCFGCGEGGDAISFIMKIENLNFIDAVKFLANKYGIEFNNKFDEKTREKIKKAKIYENIHLEAARFYFANIKNSKAYNYLVSRGIEVKTIKKFGIGYSLDEWHSLKNYILSLGYSTDDLESCGLFIKKIGTENIYDKFRDRIMFPIFDYRGTVIGFGGRVLNNDTKPKYLNSPDSLIFNKSKNLYGLNLARQEIKNDTLILVEGYMDLISVYQSGIKNVVATLGTSLTNEQAVLIKRFANNVIISYDSDEAGTKATLRAIDILKKQDINIKILELLDCKDPDDYIKKYGKKSYENQIENSKHYVQYQIDILMKKYNLENHEQNINFVKECIKIIKGIKSNVEIDYYVNYLSKISKRSVEAIKKDIYGNYYREYKKQNYKVEKKTEVIDSSKIKNYAEKSIIKIIIEEKLLRNSIIDKVSINDIFLDESKEILKYIIKNKELDKIDIEKNKLFNISQDYIKDLKNITYDTENIDNLINIMKKNTSHMRMLSIKNKYKFDF